MFLKKTNLLKYLSEKKNEKILSNSDYKALIVTSIQIKDWFYNYSSFNNS